MPDDSVIEQGKRLHRQGRLAEAAQLYAQVLSRDPENPDAAHLLGVVANQQGDHRRAAELIGAAVRRNPSAANYHCNLGIALLGLGQLEAAEAAFARELVVNPGHPGVRSNMGVLLFKRGRMREAVQVFREELARHPEDVTALNNLAHALLESDALAEAEPLARKSLALAPENAETLNIAGLVSRYRGDPEEAVRLFSRALQAGPRSAEIILNLGAAYRDLGEADRALAAFDEAIALKPDYPGPRFSRALVHLGRGDFARGWGEYEHGLLCNERRGCLTDFPPWRGESLANRNILLCAEQGLGDEIMFASILPEIIGEARHCVVECSPKLAGMYRRAFGGATIIATQQDRAGMLRAIGSVPIDVQSPIGSLALYRRKRREDFPPHRGYLLADPARTLDWRKRLDALGPELKVGISWRGGVARTGAARRSIPLEHLLPILRVGGCRFVSLQHTESGGEIDALEARHGLGLARFQAAIDDYDPAAALVCALDLVITVQTATFHLAGALGRPAWCLVPQPAEWRYQSHGTTMPWYPSARLFRQRERGNWGPVIASVAAELERFGASAARREPPALH